MQKTPIYYGLEAVMLYAVLVRRPDIHVWIERTDGTHYADWSLLHPDLRLGPLEFCASTWGDHQGLMASAMFSTGWFVKTGKEFSYPAGHVFAPEGVGEIWALSPAGAEWLASQRVVEVSL